MHRPANSSDLLQRSRRDSQRGFTLIEMIVTIGIIIMAAGFLAPAVKTMFQNRKLENAGTVIATVLNDARGKAVTTKRAHQVVFFKDGLRLYMEAKGPEDPGKFIGDLERFDPDNSGTMSYDLAFAKLKSEDIPSDLVVLIEDARLPAEQWIVTEDDIALRFLPDGSVSFGALQDVPSYLFRESPPKGADIVIHRYGDREQSGYLDVRPTGRTEFKVEERME